MGGADFQVDEGNFTRIHNGIIELLLLTKFTLREIKIVLHVIRMTYGFQRTTYIPNTNEMAEATDIHPNHVRQTLKRLIHANVLLTERGEIGFNKYSEQWVLADESAEKVPTESVDKQPNRLKTTKSVATKSVAEQPNQLQKATKSVAETGLETSSGAGPRNPKEIKKKDLSCQNRTERQIEVFRAYPQRKRGQYGPFKEAWEELNPDDALTDEILGAVLFAAGTNDWKQEDGRFVPNIVRFLKERLWLTYVPQTTPKATTPPPTPQPRAQPSREVSFWQAQVAILWEKQGKYKSRREAMDAAESLTLEELKQEHARAG